MTAFTQFALCHLLLTTIRAWTPYTYINFLFIVQEANQKEKKRENSCNLSQISFLCDCIRVATDCTIYSVSFISLFLF